MKMLKKFASSAFLLLICLCFLACGNNNVITEISLGDGLPVWELEGEYIASVPSEAEDSSLTGIYTTDSDCADIWVYSYPKDNGKTLEAFGQELAGEYGVFCNMMKDGEIPVAVINYYESAEAEPYIVQAYIYESETEFIKICNKFKTETVPLGTGGLNINMIREYEAEERSGDDKGLSFDTVYSSDNDKLPLLRVAEFNKKEFPVEAGDPDLSKALKDKQVEILGEDGWTCKDFISLYGEIYDLKKGELQNRNGLNLAFIGFVDNGIFKTRAFI